MPDNKLYYGDNLPILRNYIKDESVDLIYLDPPFNSKANYNVLFKEPTGEQSQAQITAFEDTWHWTEETERTFQEIIDTAPPAVVEMMISFRKFVGINDMMGYLTMMTIRLLELKRVLKDKGSIYLHCDPTASHYLKIVLDTIFGIRMFRNELIWQRTQVAKRQSGFFGKVHDVILFYTKSEKAVFNEQFTPYKESYISSHYNKIEPETERRYGLWDLTQTGQGVERKFGDRVLNPPTGKHWIYTQENIDKLLDEGRIVFTKTGMPRLKRYLEQGKGEYVQDIWTDIFDINAVARERLGYPTQKPISLLERIIKTSSHQGHIVLDPFCGCGTTITASEQLKRKWIGIDITHLAINLIKWRLKDMFGLYPKKDYEIIGEPEDLTGARELASQNRYQFQWWALSLINARPYQDKKMGSDTGIDGLLYFQDEKDKIQRAIVQVKSGHVSVTQIRDLGHVMDREKAEIGIFITLEEPTKPMLKEAVQKGFYKSITGAQYPKIQIKTIEELLKDNRLNIPSRHLSHKVAEPSSKKASQIRMDF